jgi:hypothetical protein
MSAQRERGTGAEAKPERRESPCGLQRERRGQHWSEESGTAPKAVGVQWAMPRSASPSGPLPPRHQPWIRFHVARAGAQRS